MSQFSLRMLRAPIGNNLQNDFEDVLDTKFKFKTIGYYDHSVESGYIERPLDNSIRKFQSDYGLKMDGRMKPGGETEATLVGKMMGLPVVPPAAQASARTKDGAGNAPYNHDLNHEATLPAAAVPMGVRGLMGALGRMGIGRTLQESWEKWNNMSPEDREQAAKECDKMLEYLTQRCNAVTKKKGSKAGSICHQSAMERYAKCLAGKPKEEWPDLQE